MRFQQTYYVLDNELRLLWVGGDWDSFAQANGGPQSQMNDVLATQLRDHISDAETAKAVTELVSAVQEKHRELRIDYRCDSPVQLRRFQMTIQPMKDGRVLLVHDLRDARTFDQPLTPWQTDPHSDACKCSFCCAVKQGAGRWTAPESLNGTHPPLVRYTLCPDCTENIRAAISEVLTGQKPKVPVTRGFGP